MAPTTRTQARKASPTKYLAICKVHLDHETLLTLLKQSGDRTVLAAKQDLSETIPYGKLEEGTAIEAFDMQMPEWTRTIPRIFDQISEKPEFASQILVILDETTAEDQTSCQVAVDAREDEFGLFPTVNFRCDFASLASAIDALTSRASEQGNNMCIAARELRNEAALSSSGVWSEREIIDKKTSRKPQIDISRYPRHANWSTGRVPADNESSRPYFPVFRTADIDAQVLDEFVQAAYKQDWGPPEVPDPRVAFITSLEPPYFQGPAEPGTVRKSAPELPREFLSLGPGDCDAIARSRFPTDDDSGNSSSSPRPELNYQRFIVMDEFTATRKTVIIAMNSELGGRLLLGRCDFAGAVICLVAPGATGLSMDMQVNTVMERGDGIIRGP
ncbi:hypothetical protein F4778DRAFT_717079 [Xylariomycetidae sp. FL2044]|nr:hypothetical protein F4778DRAFT_717079 [Xylariomycetidae sp. FL2044]